MYWRRTPIILGLCTLGGGLSNSLAFIHKSAGSKDMFRNGMAISFPKQSFERNFLTTPIQCHARSLPTIEELSSDGFMKQVSHSEKIVSMLASDSSEDVEDLLKAQLGHSDGIRGFFVTFLTMEGNDTPADQHEVPKTLMTAMNESSNQKELISLACMNVIMPTGMITMHQDKALSQQSQMTAERGVRVLRALREKTLVREECEAVLAVASGNPIETAADASKVSYWEAFFEKWGYEEAQKRDIRKAIQSVLSN